MARYRKRGMSGIEQQMVDPGKDLFAYLFILIMVFSFMLLMTTEERRTHPSGQKAPQSSKVGYSQIAEVDPVNIGRLEKDEQGLILIFGDQIYHPLQDLKLLTADGRITVSQQGYGSGERTLYLAADNAQKVSLVEYLKAFSWLGEQGINIAFADKVR
ncbi:MAG: hypothetical protein J7M09_03365 [Deltaproteobacteria bacterium]|nr:hypothetical protein [Candidatus Tharpella sp.]